MIVVHFLAPALAIISSLSVCMAARTILEPNRQASQPRDISSMYPNPLEIILTKDEHSDTSFVAEVFNPNTEKIKVLGFGSFLHHNVPIKPAEVLYQGKPAPFLGVTPRLTLGSLTMTQFRTIRAGKSIKVRLNVAEQYDLSQGEEYTVHMNGTIPVAEPESLHITGYIPYYAHTRPFKVDRRAAELARARYLETKPEADYSNCGGGRREKILRESLSQCMDLAVEGAEGARSGEAWRLEEAFGSADQTIREHVASVFVEAEQSCNRDFNRVDAICVEYFAECLSWRKIVTAYIHEPTREVRYCDQFFSLPAMPKECAWFDTTDAWGRQPSRASTALHQTIRANFRKDFAANNTLDNDQGLSTVLSLSVDDSLKNADNYELFASHLRLGCKPINALRDSG